MRNKNILVMIVIAVCLCIGRSTLGANLYTYDLDSLVYMSPQIVEGTVGGSRRADNNTVWPIKISMVHKGNLKIGQSINVIALDFFRISKNTFGAGDDLKEGDKLFFFGGRARSDMLYNIPTNAEIYGVAPSGIRLVVGEKALGFCQYDNPGPYIAVLEGASTNTAVPTVTKLRDQIGESIVRVENWRPLLERNAKNEDIPSLLEILRVEKSFDDFDFNDYRSGPYVAPGSITDKVCKHLISLHDVSALTNAILINDKLSGMLSGGFDSEPGRQFLWSNITDRSQAIEVRIKWATLLSNAGMGDPTEHHLKHIAEFAVLPDQDHKLQTILLDSLQQLKLMWPFTHLGTSWDASAQAGVDEAASILKPFSEQTDSEEIKYEIDLVLSAFNGRKDGIVSILRFADYDTTARELHYSYDILVCKGVGLTTEIAFQNVKSGQKWNLPAGPDSRLNDGMQGGGANRVTLPNDLPKGRYRVFLEYLQQGKVVSTSHYFETDL